MENIKYTTDGKKVIVLGNLNNQEKIVQEVFIVNDIEIPSGENFVVKSLHDFPVVSWQHKQESDLKKRIDSLKLQERTAEEELNGKRKKIREIGDTINTQLNWMVKFRDKFDEITLNRLSLFIEGKVKFLVTTTSEPKILSFEEFMSNEYGMKLLSMFGKDDGTMSFAVGKYSDGSGTWRDEVVIPAETYDDAIILAQKSLDSIITDHGKVYDSDIKSANKYGLFINPELLKAYYDEKKQKIEKDIEQDISNIEKKKQSILEIDNCLNAAYKQSSN